MSDRKPDKSSIMIYKLLIFQHISMDNMLDYLQQNGFVIDVADEDTIVPKLQAKDYDICLLDSGWPDRYSLIKEARKASWNAAIIFLVNANVDILPSVDAVNAFNAGADDYICKPYDIAELVCRFNAVLKRSGKSCFGSPHALGDYIFDPVARTLSYKDEVPKNLSEMETKLILMLSEYRGAILPRNVALKTIWIDDNVFNSRSMDVFITKIRKYFVKDKRISITNVRGQGFSLIIE